MGTSSWGSFMPVMQCFAHIDPVSILDVGIGFGRYGFMARELLDYNFDSKGNKLPWRRRIDGVEVYKEAIMPYHQYIYDNIYLGNAWDIIKNQSYIYDLIYVGDVLEHFARAQALEFIEICCNKSKSLMINTPYAYYPQEGLEQNEYENHLSGWFVEDFKQLGAKYIFRVGISLIAIFSIKEFNLPLAETAQDKFTEADIKNIKLLTQKYLSSKQTRECYDICEKYYKFLADDFEFNIIYAHASELLQKRDCAYTHAEKALKLAPKGGDGLCLEIMRRNSKNQ